MSNDRKTANSKTGDKAGQQGAPPKDATKATGREGSSEPNPKDTGNGGQKYK